VRRQTYGYLPGLRASPPFVNIFKTSQALCRA